MALILVINVNTWVTIAEADSYLEGKFDAGAWAPLSDTIKKQLLITAYRWIVGTPELVLPAVATDAMKNAQIELAWWVYKFWTGYDKRDGLIASGVKSFRISKFSENFTKQDLPKFIKDLLADSLSGEYFPVVERELD